MALSGVAPLSFMEPIKTPWNQPLNLPKELKDFQDKAETMIRNHMKLIRGPDDAKPSELTDFQLCVRAGVPLKMEMQPDGMMKVTTEKKCSVVRDENGDFLYVYVLE